MSYNMRPSTFYIAARTLGPDRKTGSTHLHAEFASLEEKLSTLAAQCRDGELRGLPLCELLSCGGSKRITFIDIDTRDHAAFEQWAASDACPWPPGSFVKVPSSSGKVHVYVQTAYRVGQVERLVVLEALRKAMPPVLRQRLDVVGGQASSHPVYLPLAASGRPVLPQELLRSSTAVWDFTRC